MNLMQHRKIEESVWVLPHLCAKLVNLIATTIWHSPKCIWNPQMSRKTFRKSFFNTLFALFRRWWWWWWSSSIINVISATSFPGHILNNPKTNRTKITHLSASRAIKTHNGPMGLPTTTPTTSYRSFRSFLENVYILCRDVVCVPPVKIYHNNDCSAVKITFSPSRPRPRTKENSGAEDQQTVQLEGGRRGVLVIIKRAATCDEDEQTMDTILGKQQFQIPPRLSTFFNGQKCETRAWSPTQTTTPFSSLSPSTTHVRPEDSLGSGYRNSNVYIVWRPLN